MTFPLTVLSSPSSVLRDQLVQQLLGRRPGLVVVVHDIDDLWRDGTVRRRVLDDSGVLEDERVHLEHGCVSCTLREDVLPALVRVAQVGRWQQVVLALPVPVTADGVLAALEHTGPAVSEHVRLDGVTTLVDAVLLREQVSGDDPLSERGLAAAETDERSMADLVVEQVDSADVLAVLQLERVTADVARTVDTLLAHLAPLARRVALGPDGAGCEAVVGAGRGGLAAQDRARLGLLAHELLPAGNGVATLVWRSDRPLHAARLHDALEEVVVPVQRSRGHVQLANRPTQVLAWESAGTNLSLGVLEQVHRGTPCCELVLTGLGLDVDALQQELDGCVATDSELVRGAADVVDPFRSALGHPAPESR